MKIQSSHKRPRHTLGTLGKRQIKMQQNFYIAQLQNYETAKI